MRGVAALTGVLLGTMAAPALADDHAVTVGPGLSYSPDPVSIDVNDTVTWSWADFNHSVTADPNQAETFDSGVRNTGAMFGPEQFTAPGCIRYFCTVHGNTFGRGMAGVVLVGGATSADCPQMPSPPPGGGTPPPGGGTPGGTQPPSGGDPGATTDTVAPRLSSVRASPSAICTKRSDECRRPGLVLRFRLDEAATVTGVVQLLRLARKTARTVKRLRLRGKAGSNRFRYSGRGLKSGSYRIRLRALDASGNRSTLSTVRFLVK
jgi:plastocyanin